MKKELICLSCPMGCKLTVDTETKKVSGNRCPRGEKYGLNEITNPVRIITSTIKVENGKQPLVSVKTSSAIKKNLNFECMKIINKTVAKAPIKIGDIIIKNVLNTGANIIATKNVDAAN